MDGEDRVVLERNLASLKRSFPHRMAGCDSARLLQAVLDVCASWARHISAPRGNARPFSLVDRQPLSFSASSVWLLWSSPISPQAVGVCETDQGEDMPRLSASSSVLLNQFGASTDPDPTNDTSCRSEAAVALHLDDAPVPPAKAALAQVTAQTASSEGVSAEASAVEAENRARLCLGSAAEDGDRSLPDPPFDSDPWWLPTAVMEATQDAWVEGKSGELLCMGHSESDSQADGSDQGDWDADWARPCLTDLR